MATKTKKTTKKVNKPTVAKKVNTSLINASIAAINTTVENGEKWQKLGSKLIKKSEKVREQQINMIFDTAEAVKGQFISGTDRIKDLVGFDAELVVKAKDIATNNPVSKKVVRIVEEITEKVSENPMVQKAEKATEDMKNMGKAKFNELKGDVLDQASKILDKGEAIIEEAKATPTAKVTKKTTAKKATAKKAVAKKTVAKKTAPKKTVVKKVTTTKATAAKVVAKTTPKKTVARKATASKATVTKAANAAPKKTVAKKVSASKAAATKAANAAPKKTAAKKVTSSVATPKKAVVKKATPTKTSTTKMAAKATPVAKVEVKKTVAPKSEDVKTEGAK